MKRKTWAYGAAITVALGLAIAWALAPRPVEVELAKVTQGRFESTIDEDGKTRLAERYIVSAPLSGHLSRITLHEGDTVEANAAVAVLRPVLPALIDERTLRELRARVEGAEANLLRAGTRVERARVALEQARNEARRTEELARQGFVAPTKLDTDRLSALAAQKEVESASAERHVAAHDVEQARAALGTAHPQGQANAASGFQVRAPVAGRVLRVLQTNEGNVALGTPLLELGDTSRLEIVAELLTTDALAAQPGSAVIIERWGRPAALQGRVSRVEPGAFTKVSALGVEEQRVRVLINITSPHEQVAGAGRRLSGGRAHRHAGAGPGLAGAGERGVPAARGRTERRQWHGCGRHGGRCAKDGGVHGRGWAGAHRPRGAGRPQRQHGLGEEWPGRGCQRDRLSTSHRARRRAREGAQGVMRISAPPALPSACAHCAGPGLPCCC